MSSYHNNKNFTTLDIMTILCQRPIERDNYPKSFKWKRESSDTYVSIKFHSYLAASRFQTKTIDIITCIIYLYGTPYECATDFHENNKKIAF